MPDKCPTSHVGGVSASMFESTRRVTLIVVVVVLLCIVCHLVAMAASSRLPWQRKCCGRWSWRYAGHCRKKRSRRWSRAGATSHVSATSWSPSTQPQTSSSIACVVAVSGSYWSTAASAAVAVSQMCQAVRCRPTGLIPRLHEEASSLLASSNSQLPRVSGVLLTHVVTSVAVDNAESFCRAPLTEVKL